MNDEKRIELLSRVDIFESLCREELRELLRKNAEIRLGTGQIFYTPHEVDDKLFILERGRVRIYKMDGRREFTLEVVGAGSLFGEAAFTAHRLRDAYAEATEPSTVLAMDRAEVERLILERPRVGLRMLCMLSKRLRYYETRMEDVTLKEVPSRLASLILFLVEHEGVKTPDGIRIPTNYTHQHIGTLIGANREAVTRAFGWLQDAGTVQVRRRIIHVDNLEALERAAGRLLEKEVAHL